MAYITPDLASVFGYGPTTTPDTYQPMPSNPDDLLAALLAQHMTGGLGINQDIGGHQGQLMYSGNKAGYEGPVRPTQDIAGPKIATTMKPEQAMAEDAASGIKIPGLGDAGDLATLSQALKGMDADAQWGVLSKMGLAGGLGTGGLPLSLAKTMAAQQNAHNLAAPDRVIAQAQADARLREAQIQKLLMMANMNEKNRVPISDATKRLSDFYALDAKNRTPEALQAEANKMGWDYSGGSADRTVLPAGMDTPNFVPRLVPMRSNLDAYLQVLQGQMRPQGRATMPGNTPQQPAPEALPKAPKQGAKLTPDMAQKFLDAAGGDKQRARQAAQAQGWSF